MKDPEDHEFHSGAAYDSLLGLADQESLDREVHAFVVLHSTTNL